MKNEFYDVAFRKKIYSSLEELQADVEQWLKEYNELRPHSGKYCYGKTPLQTFIESKKLAQEKMLEKSPESEENNLATSRQETVACESVPQFIGNAPLNKISLQSQILQARYLTSSEKNSDLSGKIM